jgi:DNA invertase Pin-like site-specific DNA recombinase
MSAFVESGREGLGFMVPNGERVSELERRLALTCESFPCKNEGFCARVQIELYGRDSACKTLVQYCKTWQAVFAMKFGYARVSTRDQNEQLQIDALREAGAERIFVEKASGGRWDRPEFQTMMDHLRDGDVVIVWKLDRLSRSLHDLLRIMKKLDDVAAGFVCLTEPIDTTTPAGRMMMQMIGAFAEFERSVLRERTTAGLEAARRRGRVGGRPRSLSDEQMEEATNMVKAGKSKSEVARLFSVHPSTISRLPAS